MLKKGLLVLLTVILPVMGMTAQDVIPVRTSPVQAMELTWIILQHTSILIGIMNMSTRLKEQFFRTLW